MIKFGDPQTIADIYAGTPYLIEDYHECRCEFCQVEQTYKCSKCKYEREDRDDFRFVKFDDEWNALVEFLRCPGCHTKLLTQSEWRGLVEKKKTMYIPVKDEQLTVLG